MRHFQPTMTAHANLAYSVARTAELPIVFSHRAPIRVCSSADAPSLTNAVAYPRSWHVTRLRNSCATMMSCKHPAVSSSAAPQPPSSQFSFSSFSSSFHGCPRRGSAPRRQTPLRSPRRHPTQESLRPHNDCGGPGRSGLLYWRAEQNIFYSSKFNIYLN